MVGTPRTYDVGELTLFAGNARRGRVAEIRTSLRRLGQYRPIVVNRGSLTGRPLEVLAGNHTLVAAREEGWARIDGYEVDVDGRTAVKINLADNRLSDLAVNDDDALAALLSSLEGDYDGTGYDEDAAYDVGVGAPPGGGEVLEDDPGSLPPDPVTREGDLWVLGEHRLLCGDATTPDAYERLLASDGPVDLLWTDPPYGVDYTGKTADALKITSDDLTEAELAAFLRDSLGLAHARLRPGGSSFVCAPSGALFDVFADVLRDLGVRRHTIVWVKDRFVLGRVDYHYRHESILAGEVPDAADEEPPARDVGSEPIAFGWKAGAGHHRPRTRTQDTVWEVPRPARSSEHPTMKPVELPARAIRNHTRPRDLVLDPFAGSGSVVSAAAQLARRARMLEVDPRYCDVIVNRWEALSGAKAERT